MILWIFRARRKKKGLSAKNRLATSTILLMAFGSLGYSYFRLLASKGGPASLLDRFCFFTVGLKKMEKICSDPRRSPMFTGERRPLIECGFGVPTKSTVEPEEEGE